MKPSPESTRYSLITKIRRAEDVEAWAEFAEIYQPVIFNVCISKGMQHADATDVTQEVMARVASAIDQFDANQVGATFRGWLYRITRNMVVDFFRKQNRNLLATAGPQIDYAQENASESEESKQFRLNFQRQIFLAIAKQVRAESIEKTWQAYWQTEVQQRSVADVANELGMTAGAVYVARSRVIAKMRKKVRQRVEETGDFVH